MVYRGGRESAYHRNVPVFLFLPRGKFCRQVLDGQKFFLPSLRLQSNRAYRRPLCFGCRAALPLPLPLPRLDLFLCFPAPRWFQAASAIRFRPSRFIVPIVCLKLQALSNFYLKIKFRRIACPCSWSSTPCRQIPWRTVDWFRQTGPQVPPHPS